MLFGPRVHQDGTPIKNFYNGNDKQKTRRWHVTISCQPDGRPPHGFVYSAHADADADFVYSADSE